ncbi:YdeI/OmpD-associated family protein [Pedobacter frigiditerrae]|uniref:YdeI/OmpD-associated family protein n=1 Tax=Pedobacter frigiditerrae TaxID=2530452 RepID=UPI00292EE986|nr:YdeI/OmpD-associated family protein [Pedobacter frigiditerrae]
MENLLLKKLQIKSGFKVKVLNAPENFTNIVGDISSDITVAFNDVENYSGLLIFAITKAELLAALNQEAKLINDKTICWILYPKAKSKLASDLNLMMGWDYLKTFNLTPCASAAINETWTAIRIKPVEAQKKSGRGNAEIQTSDYSNYVDVANKTVTLPEDLKAELAQHSNALSFYESLSYSNRKEYVLWIITAKQEKTRLERIQKTVEKLLDGKKNPTEK